MTDAFLSNQTAGTGGAEDAVLEDVYVFPLSFAQQRLWFFQQMYPQSAAYNMPIATRMRGRLRVEQMREAISEVVRRHEVLRTSIEVLDGEPAQIISQEHDVSLPVLDLSDLPEAEREAAAHRRATEEIARAFDLRRGPLWRVRLLRLSAEDHLLVLVLHHIICDGWSIGVLLEEVTTLYAGYVAGESVALPELPIQYADYAVWQREWLTGEVLEEQLSYWREQLRDAPPVLALPTDRPRPQVQTLNGGLVEFLLPLALAAKLRRLCQREEVTLFMLLLAGFQALLSRLSGQTDVLVGTPIAGRNLQEVESLIGFFVNTLVLRTDLSGDPGFRELLRRVRDVCLGAYAHSELPLERLVEEVQPERSLSHSPLFQVMFALQNTPHTEALHLPELEASPELLELSTSAFDLTLNIQEIEEEIYGRIRYNSDLFEAETILRLAEHYLMLLEACVDNPDIPFTALPLLTAPECRLILEEWSSARREFPTDIYVHEMFERQAALTPDAVALEFDRDELSYAELNRRANRLAHYLRSQGVGADRTVAICIRRSLEMVVAILGVLKAGAAYVPLDPASPRERLSYMLEETAPAVLLTERALVGVLPDTRARLLCLDADWSNIDELKDDNPGLKLSPANLAYIIYTSGSTGRPKGVMVSHGNLLNTILAQTASYEEPITGSLLLMSYFFDGSLFSIFCTLTQGGTLVIPREGEQADPSLIARLIFEKQIPHIFTVPSFYSLLLEQAEPRRLQSLRVVHTGAEVCSSQLVNRHHRVLPHAMLLNEYGPTETTIWCSQYRCQTPAAKSSVPIGRPVANTEIYLLDDYLQPVPVGIVGQLHVGGAGVARGYLNRPDLTAEMFIPHPFSREPGARLYRTGDLARYEPDGNIIFLGRLDQQVKVHGYRIEPGEIEAELRECGGVRQAVVAVREVAPGDSRLVAYLVTDREQKPAAQELRDRLRMRLPDYMIPASFVFLEELPLTRNGKLNLQALPAIDGTRPDLTEEYIAPRDRLERLLAQMWQEILGIEHIGVHDNFFDLGGDSLRAAILINKLRERLGDFLYVVALFEAPTVALLSAYLMEHYSGAVARAVGDETLEEQTDQRVEPLCAVNAERVAEVRELIGAPLFQSPPAVKNPRAIFILSPPRSGSTLLRVMLAGHPRLFAPPELELLSFNTLSERREALSGKYSFWLEGTIRALMEIKGCAMEEARRMMEECEAENLSVPQFYGLMQGWIGERRLVDKTPSYALHKEVLRRAESCFEDALYIHLLRHPHAVIRSFEEAKLEQVFFRYEHSFRRRELAELIWLISQQNIREFLSEVPRERQYQLRFEELVKRPEELLKGLCDFLGLEFHAGMVEPYREKERRMTDGIHPLSQMLGDVKFHQHSRVDASVAERWKEQTALEPLGDVTWEVAEALGYEREQAAAPSTLVAIQPQGSLPPFFCVHPIGGSVFCYRELARHLGLEQPFYGLQAGDLNRNQEPHQSVEAMAADYIEALRAVQPTGPYRLGGWSLGGVVAFEMAQQLRRQGESIALVALIDSVTPRLLGQPDILAALDELYRTGTDEQIKDAFEEARREGFLPPEIAPKDFRRWLGGCRARIQAVRSYTPAPLAGRIILFKAEEPEHAGEFTDEEAKSTALGWSELATEGLETYTVSGSHQKMILEPHVLVLAAHLKRCLSSSGGQEKTPTTIHATQYHKPNVE